MAVYNLTVSKDVITGTSEGDTFDGYSGGVIGGIDILDGAGGNDNFIIGERFYGNQGTINGGAGTDTVTLYTGWLGNAAYSNVEILDFRGWSNEFPGIMGSASQLNAFRSIVNSAAPITRFSFDIIGGAEALDFTTKLGEGCSVKLDGSGSSVGLTLIGTANGDDIAGSNRDDTLNGGGGDDVIHGNNDNDIRYGGDGNDRFVLGGFSSNGFIDGGEGIDTVEATRIGGALVFRNVEKLVVGVNLTATVSQINSFASITGRNIVTGQIEFILASGGVLDFSGRVDPNYAVRVAKPSVSAALDITGTDKNDFLQGGAGDDTLNGGGGADNLDTSGGFDTLIGGAGDDYFRVAPGDRATIDGGAGSDTITTRTPIGNLDGFIFKNVEILKVYDETTVTISQLANFSKVDSVSAGVRLALKGAGGELDFSKLIAGYSQFVSIRDVGATSGYHIIGTRNEDSLSGSAFNDVLEGGTAILSTGVGELLDGRGGIDTASYSRSKAAVTVNLETNVNSGGDAAGDKLSSIENVLGSNFADTLTGDAGVNELSGADGNDTLNGGAGADTMAGGAGHDIYVVDNSGDKTVEAAGGGVDTVQSAVTYTLAAEVENLYLTGPAAIGGTGNALANVIKGNEASNSLVGLAGDDTLNGGAGADTMAGGVGNDTYVVDHANDLVVEASGGGIDTVQSAINFTLAAEVENLTLTGVAAISGTGNALANVITGNGKANILSALAGDDTINGGGGADIMIGGVGNDTYVVDNIGDTAVEAAASGIDTVQSSITYTLGANVENLTLAGTAAINATGNTLVNILTGNAGANGLNGGVGPDTMIGGGGNDRYIVDNVGDITTELAGQGTDIVSALLTWTLGADLENLTLIGTTAISGTGNTLANTIVGNAATNLLNGGLGRDTLTGGAGVDGFLFSTKLGGGNIDAITDFSVADDTVWLDDAIFKGVAKGWLTADAFTTGTAASDASDRVIYNSTTGALLFDRDGSGTTYGAAQFGSVGAGLALTHADFYVF